jgi:hypothetical protein
VGYTPPRGWVNGATQGFAWGYGGTNWYEDGATFGDYIYTPSYWVNLLNSKNPYHKIYRGKLAVLYKNDGITRKEYTAIFKKAGLDSSPESVVKYIREAQEFVS